MNSLKSKIAIVTGGSRGIGLAIAQTLVAQGVQATITGRNQSQLLAARSRLEAAGPGAVEALRRVGFRARRLEEGIPDWTIRGLPVTVGAAP